MLRSGELIGHRAWLVKHGTLRSLFTDHEWKNGVLICEHAPIPQSQMDEQLAKTHKTRKLHSRAKVSLHEWAQTYDNFRNKTMAKAGIHAFKDRRAAVKYARAHFHKRLVVVGTIEMWGVVWEHGSGYRAQCARILSIGSIEDAIPRTVLEALRARYGIGNLS